MTIETRRRRSAGDRGARIATVAGIALATSLALACAPRGPARPPSPTPALADGTAPRPFTAAQLSAAMPVGKALGFRETRPDGVAELWMRVTAADASGCTIASERRATGEPPRDLGARRSSFAELVDHARFPVAQTTIEAATVDVPAGRFATRRYRVVEARDGETTVSDFHFAPARPGPPVLLIIRSRPSGGVERETYRLERLPDPPPA